MAVVRIIDSFVKFVQALTDDDRRALRHTVEMMLLTVALFGVVAFTLRLAWAGVAP